MFYNFEVNLSINSASFWCVTLVSKSVLTNIKNYVENGTKFGTFLKIEVYASYVPEKKAKSI